MRPNIRFTKSFIAIVTLWCDPTDADYDERRHSDKADHTGHHGCTDREIVKANAEDFNASDYKRIDTYENP